MMSTKFHVTVGAERSPRKTWEAVCATVAVETSRLQREGWAVNPESFTVGKNPGYDHYTVTFEGQRETLSSVEVVEEIRKTDG